MPEGAMLARTIKSSDSIENLVGDIGRIVECMAT
jgi:hypothetical protein